MHPLEDKPKAVDIRLSNTQTKTLDALTTPKRLYPHWVNRNLVDERHGQIFGALSPAQPGRILRFPTG
jgi:hypothetical protein